MHARDPIDLDLARTMLQCVDPHARDQWVQVGKALAAEFGHAGEWVYREWSERAENFTERGFRDTWRSCLRKPGRYTAGTLVALAKQGGFQFERRSGMNPEQRARLEQLRAQAQHRRQQQMLARDAEVVSAHRTALDQWRAAARTGVSLYAQRKGIEQPEACRYSPDGTLLIPMVRLDLPHDQALRGLQAIGPDGTKRFTKGMEKLGACCRLGTLHEVGAPLLLCEGWATGSSIRAALRQLGRPLPVFVCFDAGNLREVSRLLVRLHPSCPQVLCGDDDWKTLDPQGRPLNPGRVAASEARNEALAAGVPAISIHPVWRGVREAGWTDFNDLHLSRGVAEVAQQIGLALEVLQQLRAARRV